MSNIRAVTLDDVMGLDRYEADREKIRRRVIELKRERRVALGDEITLVFENYDTVFFQIHEMLRAEQITDVDAIREELRVYNALLPKSGELSATLFIQIVDQEGIEDRFNRLNGIDEAVRIEIGKEHSIRAWLEPGRSREDRLSAVQYVRFALPPEARKAFADTSVPVRILAEHQHYQAAADIVGGVRESLCGDLANA